MAPLRRSSCLPRVRVSWGAARWAASEGMPSSAWSRHVWGSVPPKALPLALKRAGVTLTDLELIEVNEAFAVQYLAVERVLGLKRERVNVNGGAIALGHPVGMTGARLVITILYEMQRRGAALGAVALCVGGGQGAAMVLERM
jgi:acetyl-CoA acetyltransferase